VLSDVRPGVSRVEPATLRVDSFDPASVASPRER